jgi:hypothetical protein
MTPNFCNYAITAKLSSILPIWVAIRNKRALIFDLHNGKNMGVAERKILLYLVCRKDPANRR